MPVIFLFIALLLFAGCANKPSMTSGTSEIELDSARRAAEKAELEAAELRRELRAKNNNS